jgi:HlyD family secretion protein
MKKAIKWTLLILLLLGAAGYGYWEATKPLPVELVTLQPATLAVQLRETGTLTADRRDIHPQAALTIQMVFVSQGDHVAEGDVLCVLDPKPLENRLTTIGAQMESINASRDAELRSLKDLIAQQALRLAETRRQLAVAMENEARVAGLVEAQSASQAELDAATQAVDGLINAQSQMEREIAQLRAQAEKADSETDRVYQTQVDVLRAEATALEEDLGKTDIKAPAAGTLTAVMATAGQPAMPGQPLFELMADGQGYVEMFVRAADVADLSVGMQADVVLETRMAARHFPATIRDIAATAEARVSPLGMVEKRVKVTLTTQDPLELPMGTDMDVILTTHRQEDVMVIPKVAIFTSEEGPDAVWVSRDGLAARQPVTTGLESTLDVVVSEGLRPGDQLIRDPNMAGLAEGKRVQAIQP